MDAEDSLLVELMLQAEVEAAAAKRSLPGSEMEDLRRKISQCRGALAELQVIDRHAWQQPVKQEEGQGRPDHGEVKQAKSAIPVQ